MKNLSPVILLTLATSIVAQQVGTLPPPPTQKPEDVEVVRITTNLVQVDAVILDKNGNVVTDLKPEEVQEATFTITNPGVFGALFGMPIINQPQVAILGVGNIEKRPVVIDDAIAIRQMAYLTLGYDHRLIDGSVADEFMSHLKHSLENWDAKQA